MSENRFADSAAPMSDRDRIAAVLSNELFKRDAYTEYGIDDEPGQWERVDGHINITALADAVIRELGPLVRYWDKDFKELHYCRECGGWGPMDD